MNKIILSIIIVLLLLLIPSVLYLFDPALILFPNPQYNSQIESFATQNSSIVNFNYNAKRLDISYILNERPEEKNYPSYCSLTFWLKKENTFFNLSGYDYLILDIEQAPPRNMVIFIKTFVDGISKPKKETAHTLRHNEYTLTYKPNQSRYKIRIKDFITQDWWFDMMQIPVNKRGKEKYTQVSALDFQFIHRDNKPLASKKETLIITRIAFHKSYPVFYTVLNYIVLTGLFLAASLLTIRKIKKTGRVHAHTETIYREIQHKPIELKDPSDFELSLIRQYLEEHYNDPEISINLIAEKTSISKSHIQELIKKYYNCTCKQIITHIRITEAKRLLKTTGQRILEIALEVGFNDITTFNRCFKKAEGITPREYRSRLQQKIPE